MRTKARDGFIKALRDAHRWLDELLVDPTQTIESLAIREGKSERSIRMTLSLAFICPVLAEAAMGGRLPRGFCIKRLTDLPMLWSEQWAGAVRVFVALGPDDDLWRGVLGQANLIGNTCRSRRRLKGAARGRLQIRTAAKPDLAGPCVAVSVGLVRPPEGDGLADVLAGAECIQNEAGDVGSRNRRRDGARADPCGVAAGTCSRRQVGRTDDGVVEAALTDRLLLQDLVCVRPS